MALPSVVAPMVVIGGCNLVSAVVKDVDKGTTRNTAEAVVGVVGGVAGGVCGAAHGAAVGLAVMPVGGPLVGAAVGGAFGYATGDYCSRRMASEIFDEWGYNIREFKCKNCRRRYMCRVYTKQSRRYCMVCWNGRDDDDDDDDDEKKD